MAQKYYDQLLNVLHSGLPSPNSIRQVVLGENFIYLIPWDFEPVMGEDGKVVDSNSYFIAIDRQSDGGNPLSFMDSGAWQGHSFGCLEELYYADNFAEDVQATVKDYVGNSTGGRRRLWRVGVFPASNSLSVVGALEGGLTSDELAEYGVEHMEVQPYSDVVSKYPLRPSDYTWDAENASIFQTLETDFLESLKDGEPEGEVEAESVEEVEELVGSSSEEENEVYELYSGRINNRVDRILEEYDKIFAPGFQLKKPYGVLCKRSDGRGEAVYFSETGSLERQVVNDVVLSLGDIVFEKDNLSISRAVDSSEIAEIVLTSGSYEVYFPIKMAEFAFGMTVSEDGQHVKSDKAKSWKSYRSDVQKQLFSIFTTCVMVMARKAGVHFSDGSLSQGINSNFDLLFNAFTTCYLVSELPVLAGRTVSLKLRLLNPKGVSYGGNLAQQAFEVSVGSLSKSKAKDVERNKIFEMHTFEYDTDLANAIPLFAYQAALQLAKAGDTWDFNSMILGIDLNDEILRNGGKIDYSKFMTHYEYAGSRAGKGVSGLAKIVASLLSGIPVFYLDFKPDMGDLLLSLGGEAFVVQGGNVQERNETSGTHYFGSFSPGSRYVQYKQENIPTYLYSGELAPVKNNYDSLGTMFYARAVMFVMGIIGLRSSGFLSDDIGGEKGITVFFDEFSNAEKAFKAVYETMVASIANTSSYSKTNNYLEELADWEKETQEAIAGGKKPKKMPKPKPVTSTENHYYNYLFLKNMGMLARGMFRLANAGGANTEAKFSNVFVVGQKLPRPVTTTTVDEKFVFTRQDSKVNYKTELVSNSGGGADFVLSSLVAPYGADAIIGANIANGDSKMASYNPLGVKEGEERGYANNFINTKNRMFGYVAGYSNPDTYEKVAKGDENFAKTQVTYYKPLLVLSTSNPNDYFLRNLLDNVKKAKVDPSAVIDSNPALDEQGNPIRGEAYDLTTLSGETFTVKSGHKIHPAVGIREYLNLLGISDADIASRLGASGRIAQHVVDKIGYPGTWREFIYDLRPEWFFNLDTLKEAYENSEVTLAQVNMETAEMSEFAKMFPDAFSAGNGAGYDLESSDARSSLFSGFASEAGGAGVGGKVSEGVGYMAGAPVGADGKTVASDLYKNDNLFTIDDFASKEPIQWTKEDKILDAISNAGIEMNDQVRDALIAQLTGLSAGSAVVKDLEEGVDEGNEVVITEEVIPSPSGGGISYNNGGASKLDFKPNSGNGTEFSYSDLQLWVFQRAKEIADRSGGFTELKVIGGALAVNGNLVSLDGFPETLFNGCPDAVKSDIKTSRLAPYFNWGLVSGYRSRARVIKLDSKSYVLNEFSSSLGLGGMLNLPDVFVRFPALSRVVIGNQSFAREVVMSRKFYESGHEFANARMAEKARRVSQDFLRRGRGTAWNGAVDSWKRKDRNLMVRSGAFLLKASAAGIVGSAEIGVATGAAVTQTAKSLFSDIKNAFSDAYRSK